jgi:hypothetical protein
MIPIPMEDKVRIVSTFAPMVAVAFGVALAAPVSALASGGLHPFHKHAVQMHRMAYPGVASNATALAPTPAVVPVVPAKETDGLSRNRDDCVKYGCIDSN